MNGTLSLSFDYFRTVRALIRRDLQIFLKEFWVNLLDTYVLLFTTVVVFSYCLKFYGMSDDYGPFILISAIARFGFFDVVGKVGLVIADLEGDRKILYLMTLPIPSTLVFIYMAVSWAMMAGIVSLLQFPLGKCILYSQLDLTLFDLWKLIPMFLLSNLFFGFFGLWLASILKKTSNLSYLFTRILNPMYMLGAYLYSWKALYAVAPLAAFANLLNPLVYVMEGMHGATLGEGGYIPFWINFLVLSLITMAFGWDAVRRLKQKLDCT